MKFEGHLTVAPAPTAPSYLGTTRKVSHLRTNYMKKVSVLSHFPVIADMCVEVWQVLNFLLKGIGEYNYKYTDS